MSHEAINVHRVLSYGSEKVTKTALVMAVALFVCGFIEVSGLVQDSRFPGWPVMIVGLGWAMWEFWRRHNPGKPLLMLSPDGLRLCIVGVREVLIPWQAVKAVSLIDMDVSTRHGSRTVRDVTVIDVPKTFYDRFIHIRNFLARGPGWGDMFIPGGETMRIALHHEVLPVEPAVLHAEVDARWNAFRDLPRPATAPAGWSRTSRFGLRAQVAIGVFSAFALLYVMAARSGLIERWEMQWREQRLANIEAEHERWKKEFEVDSARFHREMDEKSKQLFERFDNPNAHAERQKRERDAAMPQQPLGPATGHRAGVTSIALSPDGKSLVTAGLDRTVKLWDMLDPKSVRNVGSHKDTVRAVAMLPDGVHALTAGDDGEIVLRNLADGGVLHVFDVREHGQVAALALSRDGRRAASAHAGGKVIIWDVEGRARLHLLGGGGRQTAISFAPDGGRLIAAGYDGALRLWDAATGSLLRTFGGKKTIYAVAFTPDGARAVAGGQDDALRLWDVASGQEVRSFPAPEFSVMAIAVSADGRRMLAGSTDGAARLWELETGKEIAKFDNGGRVNAVAFAPDGTILASGDRHIRLWKPNGQAVRVFAGN